MNDRDWICKCCGTKNDTKIGDVQLEHENVNESVVFTLSGRHGISRRVFPGVQPVTRCRGNKMENMELMLNICHTLYYSM